MINSTNILDFTPEIDNDVRVTDIFDLDEIQRMQDLFADATGVASIITHPNGTPITKPSNFCKLCKNIIRNTESGRINCFQSDAIIGSQNLAGPILQRCLSGGLWDAGASITVGNKHIANWLIGQVRNEEVNEECLMRYAEEIGADKTEFINALDEVPVMSVDRFKKVADMLFVYTNDLSDRIYKNLQMKRQIEKQVETNELLHKSEQSLSITLQSIGDGVISTDNSGLIANMNPVAEKLCGWSLTEAKGKPLTEVFYIINSESRIPVDNPVSKVLETGQIIGLANHTVLISKNGTEYHIADSAAPIRDDSGKIYGVVLVFSDVTEKYIAEEKLKENERSKSVLLSNLPGAAYRCKFDPEWTMEFISEGVLKLTGYKSTDLLNNNLISFNDLILPQYREYVWKKWENAVKHKELVQLEYKILTAEKQTKWVWEQGMPIYDLKGEVEALEGIIMDITERKHMEESLRESELYLKKTQEIAQLGTYTFDILSDRWTSSEVMDNIFGIDKNFVKTSGSWISIVHPEWEQIMTAYLMTDIITNKNKFDKIYKITRQNDKQERWVHGMGALVYDNNLNPVSLIGTIQDITERKNTEDALQKSEEKYRSIFENVQDVFYQVDISGKFNNISPSIKSFAGYSQNEILEDSIEKLYVNPEDRQKALNKLLKDGQVIDYEVDFKAKDQTIKHTSLNAKVVYDSTGSPSHIDGFIRDITIRKKAEKALQESEKFLKETQTIAVIGNGSYDFISGIWKNSEILNHILGLEPNDQKSMAELLQMMHPDWQEQFINQFHIDFIQNRHKFNREFIVIRQNDKAERWLHAIGEIQFGKNKKPLKLIVTIQDITERKKISIALRESEELYRSILNASPDAIVIVNMDGKIRMVSPATLPMYGCKKEEDLLGQNMFDFIAPGDKERAIKNAELMFNGYMGTVSYQIKKADGNFFFAEVNGDIIWDQNNQPASMIFIIRDTTNRKLAENALKSSQEQLKKFASHLQNVREEERILLAREIHDELGQILIALKIDLGMMKQKTLKLIKKTDAENILINFDNLFSLVDNTIKTTKKIMTDLRPEVLYLLGFIEAVKLQVHNFQERYSINCYFDCSVPKLNLNTQQSVALFRIVQESLTNIAKHSKATSSKILIFKEDDKLILEISDNGIGMKEPHKAKQGSYGLIGMRERVFLLDGELTISSHQDEGTKIKIEMPYTQNNSL